VPRSARTVKSIAGLYLPNYFRPLGSMLKSGHPPPGDSGGKRVKDEKASRRGPQRFRDRYRHARGHPSWWRPELQRPPRTPRPQRHCGWTFPLTEHPLRVAAPRLRVAAPRNASSVPRWSRRRSATVLRLGPGRRLGGSRASRGDASGAACCAFDQRPCPRSEQRTCPRSEVLVSASTQLTEPSRFAYGDRAARLADRGAIVSDCSLITRSQQCLQRSRSRFRYAEGRRFSVISRRTKPRSPHDAPSQPTL
jgi:hypothetical protein